MKLYSVEVVQIKEKSFFEPWCIEQNRDKISWAQEWQQLRSQDIVP